MKQATADDHWRRLGERAPQRHVIGITSDAIPNLPPDVIDIAGPITVITGLNGVGKSTLLHAAWLLLRRDDNPIVEISALRECKGTLLGQLHEGDKSITLQSILNFGKIESTPELIDTPVTWIDPAFAVPALIKEFREQVNLDEALDQVESNEANQKEIDRLSWLVGKPYQSCETYELELFAERPVIPYFWVNSGGKEYGSEAMGLGEASLHFIIWNLKRMPERSVVLIEEPETYVSARSQDALMNIVAEFCSQKKCSAIVTTHSPQIFNRVPPRHTLILTRSGAETRIIRKESQAARLVVLGVPPIEEKSGVFLVEDAMAREFALLWLRRSAPAMLRNWKIQDVRSSGQVTTKVKHFPQMEGWFRAIGLLDGDERRKDHGDTSPLCFLPGIEPPERMLQTAISSNLDSFADACHIDRDLFRVIVSTLDGLDHHDWFLNLAKAVEGHGISFEEYLTHAFDLWISAGDNRQQADEALLQLLKTAEVA